MEKGRGFLLTTWSGRVVVVLIGILGALGLLGLGFLLSNTVGAAQVAANARALHVTNATLGASGIARAGVAQAVFFSVESFSEGRDSTLAITEARDNLEAVATLGQSPDLSDIPDLAPAQSLFIDVGNQVVDLAQQGRWSEADQIRVDELEPAYTALSGTLHTRQEALTTLIADSERASGAISRVVFVAIAFLIPAITILIFWFVMRGRIRKSRRREAAMAERVQSERRLNEAKDDLIAGLSHELRTPLTTIYGFSGVLLERRGFDPEERELLELINASSADLSRMVNDLLTAARIDARALTTHSEVVDLATEVAAVGPYEHQGHAIDVRVPSMEVRADPLHVRQIIHNLISNAFRYGGENILTSAAERNGSGLLIVGEDGPGVPSDMEDAVFRRFVHSGRSSVVTGSSGSVSPFAGSCQTRWVARSDMSASAGGQPSSSAFRSIKPIEAGLPCGWWQVRRDEGFAGLIALVTLVGGLAIESAAAAGSVLYLRGHAVPSSPMSNSAPPPGSLPNFDPRRDHFPGLLVQKGGGSADEGDPTKFQEWSHPVGGETLSIDEFVI